MAAQELVGGLCAGDSALSEAFAALFETLKFCRQFFGRRRQGSAGSLCELISTLHEQYKVIDQLFERSFFRNQVFVIEFHINWRCGNRGAVLHCAKLLPLKALS